jgi:hypothetical protein
VPETRHKTVIEVHADTTPAKRQIQDLQAVVDRLAQAASRITVGGAVGGAAGAAAGAAAGGRDGGVGASPGQGRSGRSDRTDPAMRQTMAGQLTGQLVQSFGGGVPGMIAGSGQMIQSGLRQLGQVMQRSTNQFLQSFGQSFAGGIIGNLAGPMMTLAGAGVAARFQTAQMRATMTTQLNRAALGGVFGSQAQDPGNAARRVNFVLGAAANMGFAPTEAAQVINQWAQAKGTTAGTGAAGGDWERALRVSRTGVSIGAAAQFQGLAARGAGGRRVNVEQQIALAQQQGMRGAGIDRWLQMIAGNTQQMAQAGFTLDLQDHDRFIRSILGTEGMKRSGYRAIQMAGALARQPVQAQQQLLAGFGGVGQAAMIARAAQGGRGDIMGIVQNLQFLGRDPEMVRQAIIDTFGDEIAALFFAQQGAPSGMAQALAGDLGRPISRQAMKTWKPSGADVAVAREQAKRITSLYDPVTQTDTTKALLVSQEKLTTVLHNLGSVFDEFLQWVTGQSKQAKSTMPNVVSDARLKRDVTESPPGLAEVLALRARAFRWTAESGFDDGRRHVGFIAQEVLEVIPAAIFEGDSGVLAIEDRALLATLVNAVHELHTELQELREASG